MSSQHGHGAKPTPVTANGAAFSDAPTFPNGFDDSYDAPTESMAAIGTVRQAFGHHSDGTPIWDTSQTPPDNPERRWTTGQLAVVGAVGTLLLPAVLFFGNALSHGHGQPSAKDQPHAGRTVLSTPTPKHLPTRTPPSKPTQPSATPTTAPTPTATVPAPVTPPTIAPPQPPSGHQEIVGAGATLYASTNITGSPVGFEKPGTPVLVDCSTAATTGEGLYRFSDNGSTVYARQTDFQYPSDPSVPACAPTTAAAKAPVVTVAANLPVGLIEPIMLVDMNSLRRNR